MNHPSVTDNFTESLFGLAKTTYQTRTIRQAGMCLLDYLGVTIAGSRMLRRKGNKLLRYLCAGNEVTVIGFNRKWTLLNSALLNGMSAHVAELDDGVRHGSIHPGAPIISAVMAVAEYEKLGMSDLLRGVIVGYEAAVKIASIMQPVHRNKGYHTTGTCGTIGAAIGVAAALRFSKTQMKHTLSAACTSSSGMLNVTKGLSDLKPFNAGQAAVAGIVAAYTARSGFKGPDDVLSGEWGFISMMAEQGKDYLHDLVDNSTPCIDKVYIKPYAACRHSHPAIEASLKIKHNNILQVHDIEKVKVFTYNFGVKGHDHTHIDGIASAKMSTPFSVAVALKTGKAGIEEFSASRVKDNEILLLAKKVKVFEDNDLSLLVPDKRPAIVVITTHNNEFYRERIDLAKGEPENPLSEEELNAKFVSLALYGGKTKEETSQIIECVKGETSNFEALFGVL